MVGIACNVCDPDDVQKLANFAVEELGSINIWVSDWPLTSCFCYWRWYMTSAFYLDYACPRCFCKCLFGQISKDWNFLQHNGLGCQPSDFYLFSLSKLKILDTFWWHLPYNHVVQTCMRWKVGWNNTFVFINDEVPINWVAISYYNEVYLITMRFMLFVDSWWWFDDNAYLLSLSLFILFNP